jgi:hypothetical protein
VLRLLVTADVRSSPILVTLMMEALRSSETSVLTRATRRNIAEYEIFLIQAVTYFARGDKISVILLFNRPFSNWAGCPEIKDITVITVAKSY